MEIKIRNFIAIILVFSLLSSAAALRPAFSVMAAEAGTIASFQLFEESKSTNILDTTIYRSGIKDTTGQDYTILKFVNVKQYISGNTTAECSEFYWKATSTAASVADVYMISKAGNIPLPVTDDPTKNIDYDLILQAKSVGYAVIRVTVSTVDPSRTEWDTTNSITKSFTVRVVDDSNDRNIGVQLKVDNASYDLSSNSRENPIKVKASGSTTSITIDKIIGYDFTNLSGTYEKTLTYYNWYAQVDYTKDIIEINDGSNTSYSDYLSSDVVSNNGNKRIIIQAKPFDKENTLTKIELSIIPDVAVYSGYRENVFDVWIEVTEVIGALDCNFKNVDSTFTGEKELCIESDKNFYFQADSFAMMYNGTSTPLSNLNGITSFKYTFSITSSNSKNNLAITDAKGGIIAATNKSASGTTDKSDFNKPLQFTIQRPSDETAALEPFKVSLSITSNPDSLVTDTDLYKYKKTLTKTFEIKVFNTADDGKIYDFEIIQIFDEEIDDPANPGEKITKTEKIANKATVIGQVDKAGNGILLSFAANNIRLYNKDNSSNGYVSSLEALNPYPGTAYTTRVTMSVDKSSKNYKAVSIGDSTYAPGEEVMIMPKQVGTATVKVLVEVIPSGGTAVTLEYSFNINVVNIGVLPEQEGDIISVSLKKDKENVYPDRELYLKTSTNDTTTAVTISLDKILTADSKSTSNFQSELQDYAWEVIIADKTAADFDTDSEYQGGKEFVTSDNKSSVKKFTLNAGTIDNHSTLITLNVYKLITNEDTGKLETDETGKYMITDTDAHPNFKKSVSFTVIVNELGGKFLPVINYEDETVTIKAVKRDNGKDYVYDYAYNGEIEFMYCLKAVADGAKQTGEKWYPFIGSEMDISSLIPKSGTTAYRLGIRLFDEPAEEDGNYSSYNRKVVQLKPRQTISSTEKKNFVYENGVIRYKGSSTVSYMYRIGLSSKFNTQEGDITASPQMNPLGNTAEIRMGAVSTYGEEKFASVIFKIKIPKASAKPNIKVDSKGKYSGFTVKMLWSADGVNWTQCEKGAVEPERLITKFPALSKNSDGDYVLYLKTAAKNKSPESEVVQLIIPANIYK